MLPIVAEVARYLAPKRNLGLLNGHICFNVVLEDMVLRQPDQEDEQEAEYSHCEQENDGQFEPLSNLF